MRKTITKKKPPPPKKTKKVVSKKVQKTVKKVKAEPTKKFIFPVWTTPEHLSESDHKDLKRFYELFISGKTDSAFKFATNFDTIVRESIPSDIWKQCGGTLTKKGEAELKKTEKKTTKQTPSSQDENADKKPEPVNSKKESTCLYILKNGKLQLLTEEYFSDNKEINEAQFHEKQDIEEFIIQYHKTLFGTNTVIIDNTQSTNEYFPNMFLLDFDDKEKPRMYVIEINHSKTSLGLIYARITHFLASLKNKNYQNDFLALLCKTIDADKKEKKELQARLKEEQDISGLLSEMLENKPAILLVKDNENPVLDLMQAVYIETWGKMVRQILIKKYYWW